MGSLIRRHGVVWDVETGQIMQNFGFDICGQGTCGVHAINSAGNMIVGSRSEGFGPLGFNTRDHFIFWTEDGWESFNEINVKDILENTPGGEHIGEITKVAGINDHGQVTAQALVKGDFGQFETPGITAWAPSVALDPACPDSDPGEWRAGNGCGIPILLDTHAFDNRLWCG